MRIPIKSQVKTIDELSSRYAESEPGEVSALFLSPYKEWQMTTF
jgi:hypothetical protein